MKLVIVDDHPIVLEGLSALFRGEPQIKIVARCLTGEEALEAVERHRPDILLLDLNLPRMNGLAVLRELASRGLETRVVLITASVEQEQVIEALRLGVRGVVLKELAPRLLVQCVRKVFAGERWIENQSYGRAIETLLRRGDQKEGDAQLTPRELKLVQMIGTGMRNKEIAARLEIGEGTVKTHLHRIYKKLNVESRMELLLYAQSRDLL